MILYWGIEYQCVKEIKRICDIEKLEGFIVLPENKDHSALDKWYINVRRKKISELTDGDLARFIRQGIFLEYIIPEAIERLKINPFAGILYTGELISSIEKIEHSFWIENPKLHFQVKEILNTAIERSFIPNVFEWSFEDEQNRFIERVKIVLNKINIL